MAKINRRVLLGSPLFAALAADAAVQHPAPAIATAPGPFLPTAESLKTYRAPEWFRDAKLGIWAHWGPQAVPRSGEFHPEFCVQDVERGVLSGIQPRPWQTDTSNGDWFYSEGDSYKTGPDVIRMLADIVSKNGNLLLNVVLYPDGSLTPESQALLSDLGDWMATHAEAIYGTRPWKLYGEGPTKTAGGDYVAGTRPGT